MVSIPLFLTIPAFCIGASRPMNRGIPNAKRISLVSLRYQSISPKNKPFHILKSSPIFVCSTVSQVISGLAILVWRTAVDKLPLTITFSVPNCGTYIKSSIRSLPVCPQEPRNFKLSMKERLFIKLSSEIRQAAEKEGNTPHLCPFAKREEPSARKLASIKYLSL